MLDKCCKYVRAYLAGYNSIVMYALRSTSGSAKRLQCCFTNAVRLLYSRYICGVVRLVSCPYTQKVTRSGDVKFTVYEHQYFTAATICTNCRLGPNHASRTRRSNQRTVRRNAMRASRGSRRLLLFHRRPDARCCNLLPSESGHYLAPWLPFMFSPRHQIDYGSYAVVVTVWGRYRRCRVVPPAIYSHCFLSPVSLK